MEHKEREAAFEWHAQDWYERNCQVDLTATEQENLAFRDGFHRGYQAGSEGRWVPVSERLPDRAGWYLATVRDDLNSNEPTVRSVFWHDGHEVWRVTPSVESVVAWAELPPAYKED